MPQTFLMVVAFVKLALVTIGVSEGWAAFLAPIIVNAAISTAVSLGTALLFGASAGMLRPDRAKQVIRQSVAPRVRFYGCAGRAGIIEAAP